MKLGTVLTTIAAATFAMAQPAMAETRSAESIPAAKAPVSGTSARVGSTVRKGEKQSMTGAEAILIYGSIAAAIAAGIIIISDNNKSTSP